MAGPVLINTTKYYSFMIGGLISLLFLLLFIPSTRAAGGGLCVAPPPPSTDDNPPDPLFTLTFDVEEYDNRRWEVAYGRLIESLRTRLGSGSRWERRLGVPVLHPQTPEGQMPTRWFHLVLRREDGTSVTMRIRGDNLYVVGFQRGGDDDQWWECRKEDSEKPPLIKGSKPLGYSCNYNHLEEEAGQGTHEVGLGRHRLRDSVAQLATVESPDVETESTAQSMMVVIIMVSEATRFREIAELFINDQSAVTHLTLEMNVLIRGWGTISERVFRADQNPERRNDTFPLRLRRGTTVVVLWTAHAAELLLGILLLPTKCPWLPRPPKLLLASPVQQEGGGGGIDAGHCAEGRPLLEIISVIINDIDGEDPGQLYGTIRVTDALGSQFVYDRDRYNYEKVSPGNAATLTGPANRSISAMETIIIELDLWDRDFTVFNPDDQVSKGEIEWDHLSFAKAYDTRLSQTVNGTYGSATVNYVVFSDAVEAMFEVTLVQGNDGQQDEVYGRIVAQIGDLGIENVLLLSTTSSDYSQVWYGGRITLQRTIVAVPLSSYIRVSALLYDYDSSSADDEIAGGCTYFGAKSSGTTRWHITGQSGEIEIKVTWNPSY